MKRIPSLVLLCVSLAVLLQPQTASAGFHIYTSCDSGTGLVGSNYPDPNVYCELLWEPTGTYRTNHADWRGTVTYLPDPSIRDEFYYPRFDMRTTAQPLAQRIGCSNVAGIIQPGETSIQHRSIDQSSLSAIHLSSRCARSTPRQV